MFGTKCSKDCQILNKYFEKLPKTFRNLSQTGEISPNLVSLLITNSKIILNKNEIVPYTFAHSKCKVKYKTMANTNGNF